MNYHVIYSKSNIRTPIEIDNNRNNRTIEIGQKMLYIFDLICPQQKRKHSKIIIEKLKFFIIGMKWPDIVQK